MHELDLVGHAVPRVAAFEEAAGHTQHHRSSEAIVGPPAHRPRVVDLFGRRLGIFAELDFGYGHQPGECHSDRPADDSLLVERGIKDAVASELLLKAKRYGMDTALGPNVLAEHHHPGVRFQLLVQYPADRGDHVDALAFRARLISRPVETEAGTPTDLLELALVKHLARHRLRRRDAARLGLGSSGLDLPRDLALEVGPG